LVLYIFRILIYIYRIESSILYKLNFGYLGFPQDLNSQITLFKLLFWVIGSPLLCTTGVWGLNRPEPTQPPPPSSSDGDVLAHVLLRPRDRTLTADELRRTSGDTVLLAVLHPDLARADALDEAVVDVVVAHLSVEHLVGAQLREEVVDDHDQCVRRVLVRRERGLDGLVESGGRGRGLGHDDPLFPYIGGSIYPRGLYTVTIYGCYYVV
jgi:hypothetical protein